MGTMARREVLSKIDEVDDSDLMFCVLGQWAATS